MKARQKRGGDLLLEKKLNHSSSPILKTLNISVHYEHLKYPHSPLLNYLNSENILSYRTVSKASLKETQEVSGPCRTFSEFVIATSGIYHKTYKKNNLVKSLKAKERCKEAWRLYAGTLAHADSLMPAILYRIRHMNVHFQACHDYKEMQQEKRLYGPNKHHLDINRAWVLAQIHAGRSFRLLSDLKYYNLKRHGSKVSYTAFSKEIAAAYLAGYEYKGTEIYNGVYTDIFCPSLSKAQANQLTLKDIQADCEIIPEIFSNLIRQKDLHELSNKLKHSVNEIEKIFAKIENGEVTVENYKDFFKVVQATVNKEFEALLEMKDSNVLDLFLKHYNASSIRLKIHTPSSPTLYPTKTQFKDIISILLSGLSNKINDAIQIDQNNLKRKKIN